MDVRNQTQTRSIESDVEPKAFLELLADARRLPEWAPGFADKVEGDERQGWKVTKDDDAFDDQRRRPARGMHRRLSA